MLSLVCALGPAAFTCVLPDGHLWLKAGLIEFSKRVICLDLEFNLHSNLLQPHFNFSSQLKISPSQMPGLRTKIYIP